MLTGEPLIPASNVSARRAHGEERHVRPQCPKFEWQALDSPNDLQIRKNATYTFHPPYGLAMTPEVRHFITEVLRVR